MPCGPINSIAEVFDLEQIKHRGMRMDLPHPRSGTVPSVANPIKFQQAPTHYDRAPPTLGQHSEEILREAGYADSEIENLRSGGIV